MRIAMFWPGLEAAWTRGESRGLLLSVFFAWAICWLLMATFVWPELAISSLVILGWCGFGLTLLVMLIKGLLQPPKSWSSEDAETLFSAAQHEYLRGNWFESEAKLLQILQQNPEDVSAALLLVGVLRQTSRFAPALRRIEQLELLDATRAWQFEVAQEKRLIERAQEEQESS